MALSGLTPPSEEYKTRADVVVDGPQTNFLPTNDGRVAEGMTTVPEPGKTEARVVEKMGGEAQGKGKMAYVMSWFGR